MPSSTPSAANLLELLDVRARSVVDGARASRVLPTLVRAGLVEIETEFRAHLSRVEPTDPALEELERKLHTFVDKELREYLGWLKPASRIFQNALATTARYAQTAAGVSTVRCHLCGAAREQEAHRNCQYCGTPLI